MFGNVNCFCFQLERSQDGFSVVADYFGRGVFNKVGYFSPDRYLVFYPPGRIAQLVTCLTADGCLTADPGVAGMIPAWIHTFVEIDGEIICMAILLPSPDSRRVVVSYKPKYVQ